MKQIRVMLVDDSAVVRQVLQGVLEQEPDIKVIATASDPLFALEKLKKEWPDVIVLDVEMPRMDGITFLTKIMAEHPTPVVICSSLTEKGAETTLQAMAAGAADIITKPTMGIKSFLQESAHDLAMAVRAASQANLKRLGKPAPLQVATKIHADAILAPTRDAMAQTTERLIAIGTSTGGTQALEAVLTALPGSARGSSSCSICRRNLRHHLPLALTGCAK